MDVASYGLHWDGPVAWLVQGRGATNFLGLKKQSPFRSPRTVCNHLIPSAAPIPDHTHWERLLQIQAWPVLKAMLPIPHEPHERGLYIQGDSAESSLCLTALSRLSSPIRPIVKPAWAVKMNDLQRELTSSNIQPLVITGIRHNNQGLITALGDLLVSFPRTVILQGDDSVVLPSNFPRYITSKNPIALEDLVMLPLENIGAFVLRRFARREAIFDPMETREQRRNRMIQERNAT